MGTFSKIGRLLMDEDYRFCLLANYHFFDKMPDEEYLRRKYKAVMGEELNLLAPRGFNEKLQWLKLYNRNPEYTVMVDKYKVRDFVAEKIGSEHLIPLLGVWDDPDEIDFAALPDQFVLKCNHNSHQGLCVCKDKSSLNIHKAKKELRKALAQDFYLTGREWPYKNVPRKIICEQYMTDESGEGLTDYKFQCFDGEVKILGIFKDRTSKAPMTADYFDRDYVWQDVSWGGIPHARVTPPKPVMFDQMVAIAETLSQGIPEVRVDLYLCGKNIYFGELTFFDGSGLDRIEPKAFDEQMGDWLTLPAPYGA